MKTIFYTLGALLFAVILFAVTFGEPPADKVVSLSNLRRAASYAAQYPAETAAFASRIQQSTLTNGDFVLLQQAIAPSLAKVAQVEVDRRQAENPQLAWIVDRGGMYVIGVFALLTSVVVYMVRAFAMRNNE